MILEGLLTTIGTEGQPNIAPMGALVDEPGQGPFDRLSLRPFQTSTTFGNLKRTGRGVFHVTDNVEMLARAAVGRLDLPELLPAPADAGWILADACRWYALCVERVDDSHPRALVEAKVVEHGVLREFFGWNRAKHAVVEAAILATRAALIPAAEIQAEMAHLAVLVEKTGGTSERSAFRFLEEYLASLSEDGP